MFGKTFYPTPKPLIDKMIAKIKRDPVKILEPSAGKGDIIEALTHNYSSMWGGSKYRPENISAIEISQDLQATLRGKGYRVIDMDFLAFSGPDKWDLIIANPPFDEGDQHLLKAIDIMYDGEIIFLLNAETIRNPCTNSRKELAKKLKKHNAEIEYIQGAFNSAERKSGVEVALVYINIERRVEEDLFEGATDTARKANPQIEEENYEVSTRRHVEELVAEYNQVVKIGTETIIGYYRNYRKIGQYIGLNKEAEKEYSDKQPLTDLMKRKLNELLVTVRTDFWRRTLELKEVRSRMTEKRLKEFEDHLNKYCFMDFTEHNIRQFVLNLIAGYEKTLTEAVLEIFDKFTIRHCYSGGLYDENIHYFNGWKTNKAFKVGKKVIIPVYGGYGEGPFQDFGGKWKVQYDVHRQLRDIDVVMNYFDGLSSYMPISRALESAFARGQSSKVVSTYFTVTAYKKGTLHLTFNDENILRRFNVAACLGKNWLPHDYGRKAYNDMTGEEAQVVDSFEGAISYTENLGKRTFPVRSLRPVLALDQAVNE